MGEQNPSNDVLSAKLDFIKDLLLEKLTHADKRIDAVESELADKVTKDEFGPVKSIVFGLVGLILMAVAGAVVALVLPGHVG